MILLEDDVVHAEPDVLDLEAEGAVDAVGDRNVHAGDAAQRQPMLFTSKRASKEFRSKT